MERSDINPQSSFATCYMELCKEEKLRPLPVICVTLPHSLDLTTDRVKMDDWRPILNSLSLDQTLKSVSIRSRYPMKKPLIDDTTHPSSNKVRRAPLTLTRYLLEWLSHSLAQCLKNSLALTSLKLEGVPLPDDCLAALCVGIAATESLQHLSLQRCYIGDKNCALVCRTIANLQSIRSLNLSQCELTTCSGSVLASALSRQKLLLYHDTWKESLRYREPNLEAMPGLRRLTLNNNPLLGDLAVAQLIEAIQDNLWIKALDLQNCGLTDTIGNEILHLLDSGNTTLEIVDLRSNGNLSVQIVEQVFKKLEINNTGSSISEYRLFKLPLQKVDNRTLPVNAKRREHMNHQKRPKSATIGNSKTNYQPVINQPRHRLKLKPAIPHFSNLNKNSKYQTENVLVAKPLLHLDLQTQISSVLNDNNNNDNGDDDDDDDDEDEDEDDNDDDAEVEISQHQGGKLSIELEEQSGKTINEISQMERELREERTRRQLAEKKLDVMRRDLHDLESMLKAKDVQTRGYLLISQKSLDEIVKSFEELLKMLDQKTAGAYSTSGELIKRKIKYFLRKTKSEKQMLTLESPTKLAKSSGDISNFPRPVFSQLEKKIGDVLTPKTDRRLYNSSPSPCERARQLFAQIINGDVILNLDNRIC